MIISCQWWPHPWDSQRPRCCCCCCCTIKALLHPSPSMCCLHSSTICCASAWNVYKSGENNRRWLNGASSLLLFYASTDLRCSQCNTWMSHLETVYLYIMPVHIVGLVCVCVYLDAVDRALLIYDDDQFSHHPQTLHPLKIHDCNSTAVYGQLAESLPNSYSCILLQNTASNFPIR